MIPPTLAPHLLDYAMNTLWQLPLLAAATWLLVRLTRPTTPIQHTLWIATLLLGTLIPLHGNATYIQATNSPVPHSSAVLSSMSGSTETLKPPTPPYLFTPHQIPLDKTVLNTVARLWLLALAINLIRLIAAWITSRRLIARSTHNPELLDPAFLKSCAARLQIQVPQIRFLSGESAPPVVAGILHPILLLPRHLAHDYELTAILLHEFAHIRRRDTLTNALCRLIALPIAWHPVTPLLHARITQTREILCDTLAAEATGSPTAYARSLITLARELTQPTNPGIATLGLFPPTRTSTPLEERIMNLITPTSPALSHRAIRISAGITLVTAATLTAAAFHLQAASAAERHTPSVAIVLTSSHLASTPWQQLTPSPQSLARNEAPVIHSSPWQATPPPAPATAPSDPPLPRSSHSLSAPFAPLTPLPPLPTALHGLIATEPFVPLPPLAPTPLPPLPAAPQVTPAPPAPVPDPAPSSPSKPTHHSRIVIDGKDQSLTPAEQADLDKQLANINAQVAAAMAGVHFDQKQLNEQLKHLQSPEFAHQMAEVQKQINNPDFQRQIADASRLTAKRGVDQAMDSKAIRDQMAHASAEIAKAQAQLASQHINIQLDSKVQAEIQAQIKAATEALAHTSLNVHIDTADLQRQLDQAQKQIDEARKHLKDTPQP